MHRQRVDIGGGDLEAVVAGEGSPTVVFENGLATPLEEWDAVVGPIAQRTRTLRYDHRSATASGTLAPRSASDILSDLERLLSALALRPPYIIVGHSWGGVVARLFAHQHPSDVVGLVFVDATHEALNARALALLPAMYSLMSVLCRAGFVRRGFIRQLCPPGSSPAYRARVEGGLQDPVLWPIGFRTARAESAAIAGALAQLARECPDLPPVPSHVLTAGGVKSKSAQRVHEAWKATSARAPGARYTNVATSQHYMSIDVPDAVVSAIFGVLDLVQLNAGKSRAAI
jgi:pimeloyl-ACP methyl ester carboxylesterase